MEKGKEIKTIFVIKLAYPPLKYSWTFPSIHEREIYKTVVYEIFWERIFSLIFASLFVTFLVVSYLKIDIFPSIVLLVIIFSSFFLGLMPFFLKPWDIVLSNKRLIFRNRYWFIGRFSTIKNLILDKLESEKVSPRIKVKYLLLGFFILESFSIVLIEFSLTLKIPLPLFIELFFFFGRFFAIDNFFKNEIISIVEKFFSPFLEYALIIGFLSLIISLSIIIFSLPYKIVMTITTIGGHKIEINGGIPEDLSNLVFGISRKHHILPKQTSKFKWDIPLLEDEEILSHGRVGLINRKSQILGFLSLLLVLQSTETFLNLVFFSSGQSLTALIIIFAINVFNLASVAFSIIFSKRYQRIIATNHRLLFQEERVNVSGLWGKRIFRYSDLQKKHLQGYQIERYIGISQNSMLTIAFLIVFMLGLFNFSSSFAFLLISLLVIVIYSFYSYKAYTRLIFQAISGFSYELDYQLPLVVEKFAHRIENFDWIHNLLFANILTEDNIIRLCNDIRDNKNPVKRIDDRNGESISEEHFLNAQEPRLHQWNKMGPAPYVRTGITIGIITDLLVAIFLVSFLDSGIQISFIVISLVLIIIISLRKLVFFTYTLIITRQRVFLVKQKLSRRIARIFGILPEWKLQEVRKSQIISSQFKFIIPHRNMQKAILQTLVLLILIIGTLQIHYFQSYFSIELFLLLQFLFSILIIVFIPFWVDTAISLIPRYSLLLFTRFSTLYIPYFKDLEIFSHIFREQIEIFVENNQIVRI